MSFLSPLVHPHNFPMITLMKRKSVIVIGNFDGVHLGHQSLLTEAKSLAVKNNYDCVVLTFTPHPRSVFQPNVAPFRLTKDHTKKEKILTRCKPDDYVCLDFDGTLRNLEAEDFIHAILINRLNAGVVLVGENFHFGKGRLGNIQTLRERTEFQTIAAGLLEIGGEPVASSRIREHLKTAEIGQANALLGWDWFIESDVIHGDKRGRELGYPTANMHFHDMLVPAHGVYAVRVQIEGEAEWRQGAANIGLRPMFETARPMLETYIFDFDGDLYGKTLKIKPVQKLRDEMRFETLDDLKDQIARDCAAACAILSN